MSGINYELSKIKGIAFDVDGVLSPLTIPVSEDGNPMRMANVRDGYALMRAVEKKIPIAIITAGRWEGVRKRFELLGIEDIWLGVGNKLEVLKGWMDRHGLAADEVAYMGDDLPDLECMRHVGLPCAPADAAPEILREAIFVSRITGGHGCARDLISQVMKARDLWPEIKY